MGSIENSPLDRILDLIFTAHYQMKQPLMDGSGLRKAQEAIDEMYRLRMAANGELQALRDTAYRYESCSK